MKQRNLQLGLSKPLFAFPDMKDFLFSIPSWNLLVQIQRCKHHKMSEICSKLTIKTPEQRHWMSFWYLYCYL